MGNAAPPIERLREEPHGARNGRALLQALCHAWGRHTAHCLLWHVSAR
jgi:hypothetical protein